MLTPPPSALLAEHRPVLAYDARERDFATSIARWRDPRAPRRDVVYGRVVRDAGRTWLQYWLFSRYNTQDRGIVRTGRHEGDWEFVQIGLDADERPRLITLAQHSWAESCAFRGARPVDLRRQRLACLLPAARRAQPALARSRRRGAR